MRSSWKAATLAAATTWVLGMSTGVAQATPPFTTLAPGFTQELYATGLPTAVGIGFFGNGDVLAANNGLFKIDSHSTVVTHGSTIHPTTAVPSSIASVAGLVNGPDGEIYANTTSGVQEIDSTTGALIGAPFGPRGTRFGITVDPQTGNLVYSSQNGISFVSPDGASSGVFSSAATPDGIAFDPTGNFLFGAVGGGVAVISRSGAIVQSISLTTPGSSGSDGMAFHAGTPDFLVSNNNSGDMTRFDFPGGDYTKPPTQSVFASGGSRGDLTQVGSDGCLYLSEGFTPYADGFLDTSAGSIDKICPGFIPPVLTPTTLVAHPYVFGLRGLSLSLTVSATLTANGVGLAGETITFTAGGQTICTATTDAGGNARCGALAGAIQVILGGGYQAAFAGDPAYRPSSATAGLF